MQTVKNQAWNRRLYDGCKTTDDLRLTTGPGRYMLDTPPKYCNASFAPEPTIRQQKWGASMNTQYSKTDVESDLFNINRPTTKVACNQYNPKKDKMQTSQFVPMKEESFPQTHSRLVDPPCNLRSSGWNRWEWLCENPQEGVMMPFNNLVTTRLLQKDQHRPCIPNIMNQDSLLPKPVGDDASYSQFDGMQKSTLSEIEASLQRTMYGAFPRGEDTFPEAPSNLYNVEPAPLGPPDMILGPFGNAQRQ